MTKLIQEAALDDRFNAQMKKIQDALDRLNDIVAEMQKPGSMTKPTATQQMQVKYAAQDLKELHGRMG
jgi:Skp family chaperone for outer membrane proteins